MGAPPNHTFLGFTQGGPGFCNCIKLPSDFAAAHFSVRVLLKPNPSPVPFSDEKIKAQGGQASAQSTKLDGPSLHLASYSQSFCSVPRSC